MKDKLRKTKRREERILKREKRREEKKIRGLTSAAC